MKNIMTLSFVLIMVSMTQSCNVSKGLAGISPATALNGVQALLGGSTSNALSSLAGNALGNAVLQNALPKELSTITSLLGGSSAGNEALGLLNGAIASAVPGVASSVLGNATNGIAASSALDILQGGETGATDFLQNAVGNQLSAALVPAITKELGSNGGLDAITSALGSQAAGLIGGNMPSIAQLVSSGAAKGIFDLMGNAEKAERANPTNPVLKDIFGS